MVLHHAHAIQRSCRHFDSPSDADRPSARHPGAAAPLKRSGANGSRRIVHVSTTDLAGGAARATYRLHRALRDAGDESIMFVAQKASRDEDVVAFAPAPSLPMRLRRMARRERLRRDLARHTAGRPPHLEAFRDDRTEVSGEALGQLPEADVLNLHWIAEFIDYRAFLPEAARRAPLVWTLHDLNPFTGGCHYDLGCGRFESACGACPQLASKRVDDFSREIFRRKEMAFRRIPPERLRIVAGSRWMARAAERSRLLSRFAVTTIHCGVDIDTFRPRNGAALRQALEIPDVAFVVLFAADHIDNHRKGLPLLLDALRDIGGKGNIHLVTVGAGSPSYDIPARHTHLGHLDSDRMLSLYYSCGDCFVIPSRQEAFGLTALEAMACGTPVVGFDAGGIPDMIQPGKTGLLARPEDPGDLGRQIHWMLEHPVERRRMGEEARLRAEKHFSLERQAALYQKTYDELLSTAGRSG